ncbi:hypothetical protein K4B79_41795 [Streptomyces lincolnensis]|nr:hypothetical protein [Streptomyces lincolnensis]MCD7444726.1 hypothetical protein [Streptomyces lincolnensis]
MQRHTARRSASSAQLMRISASGERTVLVTGQVGEADRNGVYKLRADGTP